MGQSHENLNLVFFAPNCVSWSHERKVFLKSLDFSQISAEQLKLKMDSLEYIGTFLYAVHSTVGKVQKLPSIHIFT